MECTLAAISDFAYLDLATGKQYILGVIRYIWAATVPAVHPRLAATFQLEEFTNQLQAPVLVRMHLHNADGADVMPPSPPFPLRFSVVGPQSIGKSLSQLTVDLNQVQLPTFGDYAVVLVRENGDVIARAPFTVQPLPTQPAA